MKGPSLPGAPGVPRKRGGLLSRGPQGSGGRGRGGRGKQEPNGPYGSEFSEQRGGNDPSPDLGTDGVRRARTCGSAPHRRCPRSLALPCGSRALETRRWDLGTAF